MYCSRVAYLPPTLPGITSAEARARKGRWRREEKTSIISITFILLRPHRVTERAGDCTKGGFSYIRLSGVFLRYIFVFCFFFWVFLNYLLLNFTDVVQKCPVF